MATKKSEKMRRLAIDLPADLKTFLEDQAQTHGHSMKFLVVRQLEVWRGAIERAHTGNSSKRK